MPYFTSSMMFRDAYLLRTFKDGTRKASWRMWLLVWITPALFALFTVLLSLETLVFLSGAEKTTGTVVKVYEWEGWTPTKGTVPVYSPVFEYTWTDGTTTQASNGMSAHVYNFDIGSEHAIWFKTAAKGDVMLDRFDRMWGVQTVLAGLTLATLIPALIAAALIRRWLRNAPARGDDLTKA